MPTRFSKDQYPLTLDKQAVYVKERVEERDGHHIWQLCRHAKYGYPRGGAPVGYRAATRLAWEVEHGESLPTETLILPTCEEPACVNPAHMVTSTLHPSQLPRVPRAEKARAS
ncbi:HNH endonuclease [Arthrobacter phage RosiePosie]|uniref:HNH endonuclease n=14 Tax=Klausavirus princesstrina TaxID=1984784 RepID=A0A286N4C2_9CAUD|nr:endonuclease [Arthrobacter phage PrincessTrina]ANU79713.1 HNH endonuclease [Arthrobacter phage Conboy]AOZ64774.1 HNH endonuclease [Arthrobacter phage Chocolat]APC44794.1 HNH endonuclease [Arthrobacter phage EdgarPoe]APC44904.1 HNH endonuclease [Arthrobacter phage HumptyDumpty]ASX98895.1 HNH endonuclease [Arthrobacter phage Kabreeze]ASX99007.1 HNH endonuclease [Arthrobacter phage RosiePosie]ASX99119.1 HNH endonuclease [Arthrobacter phage Scavito]ASX99229.1 HNH endonuclease [Arthrobacter p